MNSSLFDRLVEDVMVKEVVSISATDTVHNALVLMGDAKVATLPVTNHQQKCVGVVSASDLFNLTRKLDKELQEWASFSGTWERLLVTIKESQLSYQKVFEIMSSRVVSVSRQTTVREAAQLMIERRLHRLPVLDEDKRVVGIVSATDLLKLLVESSA